MEKEFKKKLSQVVYKEYYKLMLFLITKHGQGHQHKRIEERKNE